MKLCEYVTEYFNNALPNLKIIMLPDVSGKWLKPNAASFLGLISAISQKLYTTKF